MTVQMTPIGVIVLCGAIVVFWATIATLVRRHRLRGGRPETTR